MVLNAVLMVHTYIHIHCKRVSETGIPFDSFTCNFCKLIPNCVDFRRNLYCESRSNIKIHGSDTRKGRRLDHLTQNELKIVARDTNSTHRLTMRSLWWERTKVATLSIRTRSLRKKLFESAGRKDVSGFVRMCVRLISKENYKVKMQFGNLFKIYFTT